MKHAEVEALVLLTKEKHFSKCVTYEIYPH